MSEWNFLPTTIWEIKWSNEKKCDPGILQNRKKANEHFRVKVALINDSDGCTYLKIYGIMIK